MRANLQRGTCRVFAWLLTLASVGLGAISHAATWNGGSLTTSNWQDAANWNGTAPIPPEDLVFDGAMRLANTNDFAIDTTFNNINFTSGAGAFVLSGNRITLANGISDNSTTLQTINLPIVLGGSQTIQVVSGASLQIGGVISGAGGINLTDLGTLTVTGANTYSGPTNITAGTLVVGAGGTLGSGTSALSLGGANAATTGNLDLTPASATVGSLTVASNASTANTITIGSGKTLTVNGNTAIGGNPSVATATMSLLTVSGAGTLRLGNGSGTLTLNNFTTNNGANTTSASIDASGLANFVANYGSTGTIAVGAYYGTSTTSGPYGSLILGTNNTLTAGNLQVGQNLGGAAGSHSSPNRSNGYIKLGTTNNLNVDNIAVGGGKPSAPSGTPVDAILFANTSGSGQTVVLRGSDGASRVSSIKVSDATLYDSNSGTASQGTIDFTGGSVDAMVSNLQLGLGKGNQNSAASTGSLIFNAGTFDVTTATVGIQGPNTGAPATGNITVSGTGNLVVGSGNLILGSKPTTAGTGAITGNLNINNGGSVTMNGNIVSGGGVANLTLNGGTLNLQGHNIVAGATNVTFNAQSGSLSNVGQVNGGATALAKTTSGTLSLSGVNSYTGGTSINGGILSVLSSVPGVDNVNSGGTLAGTGNGGSVILNSSGTIYPGLAAGDISMLSAGSLTVNGGTLNFDLGSGLTSDLFSVAGTANFTASSVINIATAPPTTGTYTVLNAGTLTLGTQPSVVGPAGTFLYALNTSDPHQLRINVTLAPVAITWNGNEDLTTWDIGGKKNWTNGTTNVAYAEPALVTFDDSAPGTATNITLNTTVAPAAMTVNSNTNNYTIAGTGSIGGAAQITKSGSSTLTLLTNNSYAGPTIVNAGTIQAGNGGTTGSLGTGPVTNNGVIAFNRTDNVTIAGDMSGSGELQQNGAGTLILTGNNTYTTTTINSGTLQIGNGGATGTLGSGPVTNNGALVINRTGALSAANVISGTGGITQNGSVTTTLTGNSTYTGATTISGGVISVASLPGIGVASGLGFGDGGIVLDGGALRWTNTGNQNSGRLISLTTNGGTIDASPINSNALTLSNATLGFSGPDGPRTLTLTGLDPSATNYTASNFGGLMVDPTGGKLSIVKNGANGWILSNASNSFTGPITINAGMLRTGASPLGATSPLGDNSLGTAPNITVASGAQVRFNNSGTYNNNISIAGTGVPSNEFINYGVILISTSGVELAGTITLTADARITGRGSTTGSTISGQITGAHALELGYAGQASILTISNTANNWTGDTTISMGTTKAGAASTTTTGVIPHGAGYGNIIINGGDTHGDGASTFLDLNGFDVTINGLSSAGDLTKDFVTNTGSNATLSVGDNNQSATYAGAIIGFLSLTKIGSGVETLSGANTYFGATTVRQGTLALGGANRIPNTNSVVLGDATNLTSGTFSTSGFNQDLTPGVATLTLARSSTIDLGAGSSTLSFVNSNTTLNGSLPAWNGTLSVSGWTYGSDHLVIGTDASGLATSQLNQFKFGNFIQGASISSVGEITPRIADINQDGAVNIADVGAMTQALSNETKYQSDHSFTASDVTFILDVSGDGQADNLDVQSLINLLANGGGSAPGGGSLTAVPEPGGGVLLALGALLLLGRRVRGSVTGTIS
jgi:fibronectin-binding autotransporter adhesin